jgi:hypothetical protein
VPPDQITFLFPPNTALALLNPGAKADEKSAGKPPSQRGVEDEKNDKTRQLVRYFCCLGLRRPFFAANMDLSKIAVRSAWLLH